MEALAQLTKGVQDALFHNIPAMLGDRGALQELMDMVRGSHSCLRLIKVVNGNV